MNESFDWLGINGRQRSASVNTGAVGSSFAGANSSAPIVSFSTNSNHSSNPTNINHSNAIPSVHSSTSITNTNLNPSNNSSNGNPSNSNTISNASNTALNHSTLANVNQTNSSSNSGNHPPLPTFRFDDTTFLFKNSSVDQINFGTENHRSFFSQYNQKPNDSVDSFVLSDEDDDSSIPLSLTTQELSLQESKTYMRWYSDILARTNARTITMNDIFSFLNNFKIPLMVKEKIKKIFNKIVSSINIGQFFALLRLISHTIQGEEPRRRLIRYIAPIPCPPSILSKKRQNDDVDNDDNDNDDNNDNNNPEDQPDKPLDLDGFTQFMLTGERPDDPPKKKKSKKLKSVKFLDQIVTDVHHASFANSPISSPQPQDLDYSLPMDQLLGRMKLQQSQTQQDEESEVLKDMESQINHFQNLHSVDSASIDGVPASLHSMHSSEHLLKPNMTGPAQMAQYMSSNRHEEEFLKPNMTGPAQMAQLYNSRAENNISPLQSTIKDPSDMARMFAPPTSNAEAPPTISLQSFTSQMTGNTFANTLQNAGVNGDAGSLNQEPLNWPRVTLPPVPARRSTSLPGANFDNNGQSPIRKGPVVPPRSPLGSFSNNSRVPPPPPPSRRRQSSGANNQPPLPPKVELNGYSNQVPDNFASQFPDISQSANQFPDTNNSGNISNNVYNGPSSDSFYGNAASNDSTANILDDLKALQEEVDKIRNMTGGF